MVRGSVACQGRGPGIPPPRVTSGREWNGKACWRVESDVFFRAEPWPCELLWRWSRAGRVRRPAKGPARCGGAERPARSRAEGDSALGQQVRAAYRTQPKERCPRCAAQVRPWATNRRCGGDRPAGTWPARLTAIPVGVGRGPADGVMRGGGTGVRWGGLGAGAEFPVPASGTIGRTSPTRRPRSPARPDRRLRRVRTTGARTGRSLAGRDLRGHRTRSSRAPVQWEGLPGHQQTCGAAGGAAEAPDDLLG